MKYTDIVFRCRKCEHLVFMDNKVVKAEKLVGIMEMDCPNCGEEGYENWVLSRQGNYKKEYGEEDFYPKEQKYTYENPRSDGYGRDWS